jgi:hypothetical protein
VSVLLRKPHGFERLCVFPVEPQPDLSGLFTGRSSLAPAPTRANAGKEPTAPTIHQGPRAEAPSDDAAMDAYMRRYFPGSVG